MTGTAYRLLDVGAAQLAVASPIDRFHAHLDLVYPHHEPITTPRFADVRVGLLPGSRFRPRGRQVTLWADGQRPFEPYPHDCALPLFEWGSNYLLSQRLNAYLLLHAGVVARKDRALILPANPGAGKTTLTCALHLAGWRFLSDEFGVIDADTGELLPMVRPAPLKNRSIDVIGRRAGATLGPLFPKTRKGDVSHFVPDRDSFLARHRRACPALVVFPRFQAGAALQCVPMPRAEAAMRIGMNSFNYQALGPLGFEAVVALARRTVAYQLVYGELDDAIAHIEALFERLP
ncbi:MAG: HprK-related kinase A [Thauera sp.]